MGRSKFPGKPSKHVNRKRINVLPPTADTNTEYSAAPAENLAEKCQLENDAEVRKERPTLDNRNPTAKMRRLNRRLPTSKTLSASSTKRGLISKLCTKNRPSLCSYSSLKRFKKDSTSLVGKFVLPSRSMHSSRVIKPNKRFINVDLNETITYKKKVVNKQRHCIKQQKDRPKSLNLNQSDSVVVTLENPDKSFSHGRVILRQARLKLHNQTPKGSGGPFSSNPSNGPSSGTVTCGVCGAVRFYRFVKQARKFNIYSCESCRKFVSQMIKRQTCGKSNMNTSLECHRGQGTCQVPPIVRSRCQYQARCPACWLKMCLRSFQMPMSLKHSLAQLLPESMKDCIFNSLPLLWQTKIHSPDNSISRGNTLGEGVKSRPVRCKNPKAAPIINIVDVKRQKVDLKGPRVKHVCRSASIVLGQPVATFPPIKNKGEISDLPKVVELKPCDLDNGKANLKAVNVNSNEDEESSDGSDKLARLPFGSSELMPQLKRDKNHRLPFSYTSLQRQSKYVEDKKPSTPECQNMISIDFCENYDFDDTSQNGFCLIASQQFPMPSICFLCGSAGCESLLHCSVCCEPYHSFCLVNCPPFTSDNTNNKEFIWICPKCTNCAACKQGDRQKIYCPKCSNAYHLECFNNKPNGNEKYMMCSKCQACRSCGKDDLVKFVGNMIFCNTCIKVRRKESSCPVCELDYTDVDRVVQVIECTHCNKWVHAKCDGLSEEYFHILTLLSESVKYSCNTCSQQTPPHWRRAIQSKLRSSFNQVLHLLSKNQSARNTLKSKYYNMDDRGKSQDDDKFHNEKNNKESVYNFGMSEDFDFFESIKSKVKLNSQSILDIKNRINCNKYTSVVDFNNDMETALKNVHVLNIYHDIFQSVFPWYKNITLQEPEHVNQNYCKYPYNENTDEDTCEQIKCVGIDSRYCCFCKSIGDGLSHLESRLLYCGQNEWVHINCALWSSEVYEEIDGSLQNVHGALSRGRMMRCSYCKQKGATVSCCFENCTQTYHFICARTSKCHFMLDKTIYCSNHDLPKNTNNVIITPTEFNIRRRVFVDMSGNKKGNYAQIEKVNVMVGSLCVTNLGKIHPSLSDNTDVIIPTSYVCSRLFWSSLEPWKLVSYKISTSVLNPNNNSQIDKNFTVDHSLPRQVIERKMKEISVWHKDVDKIKSDSVDLEDDEEPQNGADLLSPEITDAIFEELPRELLDGISVQDIFPKLMSYEDFINTDTKVDYDLVNSDLKKFESELENQFDKDLKKNDSSIDKSQNSRSCSLTLSCKLDNYCPKKRKVPPRENNVFLQLLQVDGNFDDSSSSDCDSPSGTTDDVWGSTVCEEPVTCERCQCTYRTQISYKRHLDSCEVITSESDSEMIQEHDLNSCEAVTNQNYQSQIVTQQPLVLQSYDYQNCGVSLANNQAFVTCKQNPDLTTGAGDFQTIVTSDKGSSILTGNNETFTIVNSSLAFNENVPVATTNQMPPQFCLNPNVPLCIEPPSFALQSSTTSISVNPVLNTINLNQPGQISVNQQPNTNSLEFQTPSVTLQPYPGVNKLMTTQDVLNRLVKPVGKPTVFTQNKPKPRGGKILAKRPNCKLNDNETLLRNNTPVILQHLQPSLQSTTFIPYMDPFQQPEQNIQYVATIAPQTLHPQPMVHLQTESSNLFSLLPGVQPTMIIQQPNMLENQLVLDSNGSLSWAPQPMQQLQPVYYGFETIVQNTVMQSQQFLPSTVPGLVTANSSYSTTTQVFQTSKVEPVLDVSTNGFVLLNQEQVINAQQIQQPIAATSQNNVVHTTYASQTKCPILVETPPTNALNSITLPTAPLVSDQKLPTNVVVPTPKTITTPSNRPMSRVLPMQTMKDFDKIKRIPDSECKKSFQKPAIKSAGLIDKTKEDSALKLNFQKQMKNGNYKMGKKMIEKLDNSLQFLKEDKACINNISNIQEQSVYKVNSIFNNKNTPVQIAPLKPIKSNYTPNQTTHVLPLSDKQNQQQPQQQQQLEKIEKKDIQTSSWKQFNSDKRDENAQCILYTIETQDGFKYSSTSMADLWTKVFEAVQNAREAHNMPLLPSDSSNLFNSLQILGLKTSGLKYLVEQLPGTARCTKYKSNHHLPLKYLDEEEPLGHVNGAARCVSNIKRDDPYDMFGWLASKHRKPEHSLICADLVTRRGSVNNLPIAMKFRQLKLTSKYSVGVYRSQIHRRGLFCLRDFEAGEMVIEYSGEVIRSILTDKREKFYNSKGIGCYMFRIDDNLVVDATMTGNAARFINHSCDPNCYSKVVEILGHKHIIIFALRRIICGEELTYDYKFPIEEDKIPCTCGARRCRKFLN